MSPLKSKAAKEFGTPRLSLPPPERKGHPGELYFFHSKNFFHVLFWHRHIHIPTSQARALLWWRSSAPSQWSASTRPGRASSSSTSPQRWSVCQSLTTILQVCFSLRSLSASSPSWSSWTISELKSRAPPSPQRSSQIVGAGGRRVEGLQWEALWLQGHRRPGGLGGSPSDIRLDFVHCAGGRGVRGQPCHRQDNAHELRRAEGAAQL